MGNCFKKIFQYDYNYDILEPASYSPPSAPLDIPQSVNSSTVYNSAHSDLSASFKESLVKADVILDNGINN
jgi:hypothetical protein